MSIFFLHRKQINKTANSDDCVHPITIMPSLPMLSPPYVLSRALRESKRHVGGEGGRERESWLEHLESIWCLSPRRPLSRRECLAAKRRQRRHLFCLSTFPLLIHSIQRSNLSAVLHPLWDLYSFSQLDFLFLSSFGISASLFIPLGMWHSLALTLFGISALVHGRFLYEWMWACEKRVWAIKLKETVMNTT